MSGRPPAAEPGRKRRLLVVEDERSLAVTLSDRLLAEGYEVEVRSTGEAALEALQESPEARFDLVLLDVMLPGMDGFGVCMELRRRGLDVPVLMLTARAEVREKILGLKLGADDYLGKPFDMLELLARVEALLRRRPSAQEPPGTREFGDVKVDLRSAAVTRGGEPVALSTMEYRLLGCFLEHRGEVLSRERLLDEVWGYDSSVYSRTVDVHVATLRQKIETNPSHPRFVVTVHRLGYRFDG